MDFERQIITSRQNQYVTLAAKLQDRKHRQSEKLFRFDGVKLYAEAVGRGVPLSFLLVDASRIDALDAKARALCGIGIADAPCRVLYVCSELFARISEENAPEGVIGVAAYLENVRAVAAPGGDDGMPAELASPCGGRLLLCESLRDPGNLGTVIRTAYAFGIDCLVLSRDCADVYNPKTLRGAMGTLFAQRILITDDLAATVSYLQEKGRNVYAAALDPTARQLGSFTFGAGDCAVIGNEGHGLSQKVIDACRAKVYIPMAGDAESLNASVAASVLMWEMCRAK